MGHARQAARKHYDYDEATIKEAYQRAFEYLSINGIQTRIDIKRVMDALKSVEGTNLFLQRQLDKMQDELGKQKTTTETVSEENVKIREQLAQFQVLIDFLGGRKLKEFANDTNKLIDEELEKEGIDPKKFLNTLLRVSSRLSNPSASS